MSLTTLHSHKCHRPIRPRIALSRTADRNIPHGERIRHGAIVRHGEMVNTLQLRGPRNIVLVRDLAALDLVEDPLRRAQVAVHVQVVEEGRDHVVWEVGARVGELLRLELRAAAVERDVAVDAGVGFARGRAVEGHVKGQVELAVRVVFGDVGGSAEVAGCRAGEDEVFGVRAATACCRGDG